MERMAANPQVGVAEDDGEAFREGLVGCRAKPFLVKINDLQAFPPSPGTLSGSTMPGVEHPWAPGSVTGLAGQQDELLFSSPGGGETQGA